MLVLTRKSGEAVILAENITVRVIQVSRGRVRLAIDAPKSVPVRRQEIQVRRSAQRGPSATTPSSTIV